MLASFNPKKETTLTVLRAKEENDSYSTEPLVRACVLLLVHAAP